MNYLTHDKLTMPHGFFGRQGGVSTGVYESLNTGMRSDDDKALVTENRNRIQASLGAEQLVSLHQIHSDQVIILDGDEFPSNLEADGLVTKQRKIGISALSADCGPVLLSDPKAGVIGACHAGWRGALAGIVENTVAAMCEMGAHPDDITAILGPCIGPQNYEVGDTFKSEFLDVDESFERFFHTPQHTSKDSKPHFDLPAFILSRLALMGVEAEWMNRCSYAHETDYFSYRRNTHQGLTGYGRNLSVIMLP